MIKKNLPVLTGFRAVAAYSVLLAHAFDVAFSYSGALSPLHSYTVGFAYFGMTTFFVLSGFVIYYNYSGLFSTERWTVAFTKFFIARFARLYPLYFVFLLVSVGYNWGGVFRGNIPSIVSYLTLTQSWFNFQMMTFPPAWSISTEMFFYLFFSFVVIIPFNISNKRVRIWFSAAAVLSCLLLLLLFWKKSELVTQTLNACFAVPSSPNAWGWFTYFSPYVRVFEFICGMAAAWVFSCGEPDDVQKPSAGVVLLSLGCVAGIIVFLFANAAPGLFKPFVLMLSTNFGFAPFIACLLYILCRYDIGYLRFLSSSPAIFCGEISYSVYILQFHVFSLFPAFTSAAPGLNAYALSSLRIVLFLLFATIFSYGSFLMIEKPARSFIRTRLTAIANRRFTA